MSLVYSSMLALNTLLVNFTLPNVVDNTTINLESYAENKPVVIAFICNHCPYVKHIMNKLVAVGNTYHDQGVAFIAISSNDADSFPADAFDKMQELAIEKGFKFPYCYDADQQVAKAYNATCTPDFYCFDKEHKLVYRGRFDQSQPENDIPVTGKDLTDAIDAVLNNTAVSDTQLASSGCSIKWKQEEKQQQEEVAAAQEN